MFAKFAKCYLDLRVCAREVQRIFCAWNDGSSAAQLPAETRARGRGQLEIRHFVRFWRKADKKKVMPDEDEMG